MEFFKKQVMAIGISLIAVMMVTIKEVAKNPIKRMELSDFQNGFYVAIFFLVCLNILELMGIPALSALIKFFKFKRDGTYDDGPSKDKWDDLAD